MLGQVAFGVKNLLQYQPDIGCYLVWVPEHVMIKSLQDKSGTGFVGTSYQVCIVNMPGTQWCYLCNGLRKAELLVQKIEVC